MGLLSSLSAHFIRDSVKAYSDAKKEVRAEIEKNHGFLHDFEYLDDELYKKHAVQCVKYTNLLMKTLEEIFESSSFTNEKKILLKRTILAYPYYAVLYEQGGGVNEVQERFLNSIAGPDICYSGDEIKAAAQSSDNKFAIEIEEYAALKNNQLGKAWIDLLSIEGIDRLLLNEKIKNAVDYLACVAVNFAQMADVIVEQLLKEEIKKSFEMNSMV